MRRREFTLATAALGLTACARNDSKPVTENATPAASRDVHSHANPGQVRVRHVSLDLDVRFPERVLQGTATLDIERRDPQAGTLVLDSRALDVRRAEATTDGQTFAETPFTVGQNDAVLGAPLTVTLPPDAKKVRLTYATRPEAAALQWLNPPQTAGKKHPFLFTQSQAIQARSWIPLQDSPGVRVTYDARIRTPKELVAVMSAENDPQAARDGEFSFRMPQAIPSYLIALAVGDLQFRPMSARTGVYAEPALVEKAAREFADTEAMMVAVEKLYGPYRWGRYDLLVLPPSFPFGGMENPRLTFATPTIIAGDKSLVALVAHELAHSWSGNLVTNATWRDFWLNEGFTVYLEQRIQEAVFGRKRADMEAILERQELENEMKTLASRDQVLHVDLAGRDPDEGFTQVPYVKGALFLKHLEEAFGRAPFDRFLRTYFDSFAFKSITTAQFREFLQQNLLSKDPAAAAKVPVGEWIEKPGLPASAPRLQSDAFVTVEGQAKDYIGGQKRLVELPTKAWSTPEWIHFLRALPSPLPVERMKELDAAFRLTESGNSEVLFQWLLMSIRSGYEPARAKLEEFLRTVGRRKYIKPLYEELVKTPEGRDRAKTIYAQARPMYHPMAQTTIDGIVR